MFFILSSHLITIPPRVEVKRKQREREEERERGEGNGNGDDEGWIKVDKARS